MMMKKRQSPTAFRGERKKNENKKGEPPGRLTYILFDAVRMFSENGSTIYIEFSSQPPTRRSKKIKKTGPFIQSSRADILSSTAFKVATAAAAAEVVDKTKHGRPSY